MYQVKVDQVDGGLVISIVDENAAVNNTLPELFETRELAWEWANNNILTENEFFQGLVEQSEEERHEYDLCSWCDSTGEECAKCRSR